MFKKTSSRNQRSKDIKIKHVLQMCLLLGVCFWLIYQLKHSHDKRKEIDAKDAKVSVKEQTDDLILKFGRKDLPHVQEVAKNHKHEEEEEEENGLEDENKHDEEHEEKSKRLEEDEHEGASKHEEEEKDGGSNHGEEEHEETMKHEDDEEETMKHEDDEEETMKHEDDEEGTIKHEEEEDHEEVRGDEGSKHDDEEEQEAEVKDEEAEDEGKGDGDDEVDGNEQERDDGEVDREEVMDDEKERETGDIENEGKENEENEQLANDRNLDGVDGDAHEAREKHYTADDASSAVSHDTQSTSSEADKLETENSNGNSARNVLEQESKVSATEKTDGDENKSELKVDEGGSSSDSDENKSELKVDEDKHSESDNSLNATHTKENDHETVSANSQHISLPTTNTTDFIDQASNITTEVSKEAGNIDAKANTAMPGSLQNGTSVEDTREDGMVTEEKYKERANETTSNSQQSDSNTVDASKIGNVDSTTTESSNSSINAYSGMSDDTLRINATAGGQSSESSMMKADTDSTQHEKPEGDNESSGTDESSDTSSTIDSSDSALSEEEKDSGVDLSTLPDITTGGSNNEDTVAE